LSPSAVEERERESTLLEAESLSLVRFSHVILATTRKEMSEEQIVLSTEIYKITITVDLLFYL
jgi:hypothetical protein